VYREHPHTLNELKTAITVYVNISQADVQKVFVNKIKQVQACIDACGHFQTSQRLSEHTVYSSYGITLWIAGSGASYDIVFTY